MEKPTFQSKIIFFFSIALIIGFTTYLMSLYLGYNPLNKKFRSRIAAVSLLPEGWAFFTKNSRETVIYLLKHEIDGSYRNINLRNFSFKYKFGFSRENRIKCIEISNLVKKIVAQDSFKNITIQALNIDDLLSRNKLDTLVINDIYVEKSVTPHFEGKYIVVFQDPLAWSLLHRNPQYHSKFVICPVKIIKNNE